MPEFILNDEGAPDDLTDLERGFLEALFFTAPNGDGGEGEEDLTGCALEELASQTLEQIRNDCRRFEKMAGAYFKRAQGWDYNGSEYDAAAIGRDFLFTRNGHGVGFWDRPRRTMTATQRDAMEHLDHFARKFSSEFDLYRGDDGRLYVW